MLHLLTPVNEDIIVLFGSFLFLVRKGTPIVYHIYGTSTLSVRGSPGGYQERGSPVRGTSVEDDTYPNWTH